MQIGKIENNEFRNKLFNAQFNTLSMDSVMIPWEARSESLESQIEMARSAGMMGIFVEMPFRSNAVGLLDWIDPRSESVGSIDIVSFRNGRSCGYNSEIYGIADQIHESGIAKGSRFLVLGTGAGGRSAAVAASMMGMETFIAGPNLERSRNIAEKLGGRIKGTSFNALSKPGTKFDVIINSVPFETRSSGLMKDGSMDMADMAKSLEPSYGIDLYYRVHWTPFLSSIESRGGVPISGVDILVRSNLRAFKLLTGMDSEETYTRSVIADTVLN
jgi:shikimate dehydrogenase